MSISKDFSEVKQQPILQSDWISFGTTRSKFINEFADETLKKHIAHPVFTGITFVAKTAVYRNPDRQ